jgi:hypothetical protein
MIRLGQVLEIMDKLDRNNNPVRFDIKFVTADRAKQIGGEIIELKDVCKCVGKRNGKVVFDTRNAKSEIAKIPKAPKHWVNSTRNLLLSNGQIRKIHIRLIIGFNGQKVCF